MVLYYKFIDLSCRQLKKTEIPPPGIVPEFLTKELRCWRFTNFFIFNRGHRSCVVFFFHYGKPIRRPGLGLGLRQIDEFITSNTDSLTKIVDVEFTQFVLIKFLFFIYDCEIHWLTKQGKSTLFWFCNPKYNFKLNHFNFFVQVFFSLKLKRLLSYSKKKSIQVMNLFFFLDLL